ncbi:MAG: dihydrodipicolinate synthase family protein [Desulfobacterales bacterium]|nr:dihydrodipicolinate synthase family protein [Desulfobacterales bacterium]
MNGGELHEVSEARSEGIRAGGLEGRLDGAAHEFTEDDRLDEKGIAFNLEHCISRLKVAGHYCSGNIGEFWALTNEERMRAHEVNVETAKGRIPLIAGCHHQNPYEAVALAKHAQAIGIDFVIILTPYIAVRCDDAVYDYYKFVADRVDIGIVLFNIPQTYYPISGPLARRLATIPNICGLKMAGGNPQAIISMREAVEDQVVVSVADDAVALQPEHRGRPVAPQLLSASLPGAGLPAGARLHPGRPGGRHESCHRDCPRDQPAACTAREMDRRLRPAGRAGHLG